MSIYKQALGKEFERLHTKLQKRYALPEGAEFRASGVMREISGGPRWLSPFFALSTRRKFLFPETGRNIPFTIINRSFIDKSGKQKVHWERTFHFGNQKRYFNALMSMDPIRREIEDYLGEPALFYSDLSCSVNAKGQMRIVSGKQRFLAGKWEIPLPVMFQGIVDVIEGYDEVREMFTIQVTIRNPILGRLFYYEGEFNEDEN